ncbi:MAG: ribonuclease G [Gammaproteobacteria bacterium]|nr:ribonuclease G [Gammaproteobacteria bacterium]
MSAELLINVTPRETRVAFIENGMLQEFAMERTSNRGIVGNIYRGKVSRVLPGMQAAFVDIGLERAAFLHASDITPRGASINATERLAHERPADESHRNERYTRSTERLDTSASAESISQLVQESQELLVQVIKDPIGTKGARLTTGISVPACYLVYLPRSQNGVGVSQRIEDEEVRERLRSYVEHLTEGQESGRFIVRTAAECAIDPHIQADVSFLNKLWNTVSAKAQRFNAPTLVHEDLPLLLRTLREMVGTDLDRVRVDSSESFKRMRAFTEEFLPELSERVEHYPGERPIFDLYSVEDELERALQRQVPLKSGGHLVIDQTEAMTTIDVNTGAYVGHRNLGETIFKTNLEAAQSIARQLRLRNLGGIIIIDFIDMDNAEHRRQVLRALEKWLERDPTKTQVSDVSALGLVEMTRKRTRESLGRALCDPCPTCNGNGFLKSAQTVCYEIFREILREARQYDAKELLVLASHAVVDLMVDEESANFAELEEFIGRPIKLQVEPLYNQAQYDVVLM